MPRKTGRIGAERTGTKIAQVTGNPNHEAETMVIHVISWENSDRVPRLDKAFLSIDNALAEIRHTAEAGQGTVSSGGSACRFRDVDTGERCSAWITTLDIED